jgi:cystathionine beta-synthase
MQYAESILDLVGDTPLVRLTRVTRDLGRPTPAARPREARDAQPGRLGEGPDRAADDRGGRARRAAQAGRHDHRADVRQHRPRPRDRGRAQGLPLHLRHGRQAVAEKQALLRAYGAEVVLCPTNVDPESPASYYSVAPASPGTPRRVFKPDQYWNLENPTPTSGTTGPEIWEQDGGRLTFRGPGRDSVGRSRGAGHYLRGGTRTSSSSARTRRGSVRHGDHRRADLTEGRRRGLLSGYVRPGRRRSWVRSATARPSPPPARLTREEGILAGGSCGTAPRGRPGPSPRADRGAPRRARRSSS